MKTKSQNPATEWPSGLYRIMVAGHQHGPTCGPTAAILTGETLRNYHNRVAVERQNPVTGEWEIVKRYRKTIAKPLSIERHLAESVRRGLSASE